MRVSPEPCLSVNHHQEIERLQTAFDTALEKIREARRAWRRADGLDKPAAWDRVRQRFGEAIRIERRIEAQADRELRHRLDSLEAAS